MIPDLIYVSRSRLRDRHVKLNLYAARGVDEYWILDPESRSAEIHRGSAAGPLDVRENLRGDDSLSTPLLPGFQLRAAEIFEQPV